MKSPAPQKGQLKASDNAAPSSAATHVAANENQLQEYLASHLSTVDSQVFEQHLEVCPACAALCEEWREFEADLKRRLKPPALSPDFASRLWAQIQADPLAVEQEGRAQQKQQIEAELAAFSAKFQKHFRRMQWRWLLDGLGFGTAAVLGCYYLSDLGAGSLSALAKSAIKSLNPLVLPLAAMAGAAALLAGCWLAAKDQMLRWLS